MTNPQKAFAPMARGEGVQTNETTPVNVHSNAPAVKALDFATASRALDEAPPERAKADVITIKAEPVIEQHGATPDDWGLWATVLGCAADLLPVVSNPKATISGQSNLKTLGKTPSRYNRQRQVGGFAEWTQYRASANDISTWKGEPDYGICLQTRELRAIDVDITDAELATKVRDFIAQRLPYLPTRSRSNSPKFLQLIELRGEYGKRRIITAHGAIEFLATGQQCVVAGTHPSGVRYEWDGGPPVCVPVVSPEEFETLWQGLQDEFGTEPATTGKPSSKVLTEVMQRDPIAKALHDSGMVRRTERDGRLHIACPWEAEHTTDTGDSSTTYFPAHTGGYVNGHFKCLHAHCEGRGVSDLAAALGIVPEEFEALAKTSKAASPPAAPPAAGVLLTGFDDIEARAVNWLWDGWLARGKLHILAGRPGTGKTTVALALAAIVSSGGLWLDGGKASRGQVLIWSGEDDLADTIKPRLMAMGADVSQIRAISGATDRDGKHRAFDPATDMPALAERMESMGVVDLIIIDSIVSAVGGDSHKNTEVRRGLQPVVDVAARFNCAVLGISHYTKGSEGRDPVERVSGSLAFGALARLVWVTAKQPEEEGAGFMLVRAKSNLGPDGGGFKYGVDVARCGDSAIEATRIVWGDAIEGHARELLDKAEGIEPRERRNGSRNEAAAWLLRILEDGPQPVKAVSEQAEAEGFSEKTMRRAREKLQVQSIRVGGVGNAGYWTWGLPEGFESLAVGGGE